MHKYIVMFFILPLYAPYRDTPLTSLPHKETSQSTYGTCPKVKTFLKKTFYKKVVENFPVFCVDIFLLNQHHEYLVVYRKNPPAQHVYWLPGGRLLKGESFFDAAERKCLDEIGIQTLPKKILCVKNLMFKDSAWKCPTHTPAIVILATCTVDKKILLPDKDQHEIYQWRSIFEKDEVDYNENARLKALKYLKLTTQI